MPDSADRWLTFDCFGTLVSWQSGFPKILERVAGARAEELAAAYHPHERLIEARTYRPYKDVLREALIAAARDIQIEIREDRFDALSRHWDEQPVFADVAAALHAAREQGWKLAALTNCDNDLFARTRKKLPFAFDALVTAEDVRSYKPAPAHFLEFRRRFDPPQWLHVACSYYHDVTPARELGIRCIWIDRDRTGEDPSAAFRVLPDLRDLPQTLHAL